MIKAILRLNVALSISVLPALAIAESSSSNYTQISSNFDNGGGLVQSSTYSSQISIGQVGLVGRGSSSSYSSTVGFFSAQESTQIRLISATYNAQNGQLVVTGVNFTAIDGATNDIDASTFTLSGENGQSYILTDTPDVEIDSATQFTLTLSATDQLNVEGLLNRDGETAADGTAYNLAGADSFNGDTTFADSTDNPITVSNTQSPTISSVSYNGNTGILTINGSGFVKYPGDDNDIDLSLLSFVGSGGSSYTLTTSDVEISASGTISITLSETDQTALTNLFNNGDSSYDLNFADNWLPSVDSNVDIAVSQTADITQQTVILSINSPKNLLARGILTPFTTTEYGVSATTNTGQTLTASAYFRQGDCATSLPANPAESCQRVPVSGLDSGTHQLWWYASHNSASNHGQQTVNVLPRVSFVGDAFLSGNAGSTLKVVAVLSGATVNNNAFSIPFNVTGTATQGTEFSIDASTFNFQAGKRESDPVTITQGVNAVDNNTVILTLDSSQPIFATDSTAIDLNTHIVTAGDRLQSTITLAPNRTSAPRLFELEGQQGTIEGRTFSRTEGNITLDFDLTDTDGGNYSFSWANSNNNLVLSGGGSLPSATDQNPVLDISSLAAGRYYIEVSVLDNTHNGTAVTLGAMLTILEVTPVLLDTNDSDGDGESDASEGYGDTDGDGIADYLDPQNGETAVILTQHDNPEAFFAQVRSGIRMIPGIAASSAQTGDIKLSFDELEEFGQLGQPASNVILQNTQFDHLFDYEIEGFTGNTVQVMLPLSVSLTADSAFHKYDANNGWTAFDTSGLNNLEWANWHDNIVGVCPELLNDSAYSNDVNQKAGANCLRVTLVDGGPNDADGVINGRVIDPLGVGLVTTTTTATTGTTNTSCLVGASKTATTDGSVSRARFTGGTSVDNTGCYESQFYANERLTVKGHINLIATPDLNQILPVYVVASWNDRWYMKNDQGQWLDWTFGDTENLVSVGDHGVSKGLYINLTMAENLRGLSGNFKVYYGYRRASGEIVYNQTPIQFELLEGTRP